MNWRDPERIKKWKPLAFFMLFMAVAGAISSFFGYATRISKYFERPETFSGDVELARGLFFEDNESFRSFLERNIAKKVSIDAYFVFGVSDPDENAEFACLNSDLWRYANFEERFGELLLHEGEVGTNGSFIVPIVVSKSNCNLLDFQIPQESFVRLYQDYHTTSYKVEGEFIVSYSGGENDGQTATFRLIPD